MAGSFNILWLNRTTYRMWKLFHLFFMAFINSKSMWMLFRQMKLGRTKKDINMLKFIHINFNVFKVFFLNYILTTWESFLKNNWFKLITKYRKFFHLGIKILCNTIDSTLFEVKFLLRIYSFMVYLRSNTKSI